MREREREKKNPSRLLNSQRVIFYSFNHAHARETGRCFRCCSQLRTLELTRRAFISAGDMRAPVRTRRRVSDFSLGRCFYEINVSVFVGWGPFIDV